MSRKQYKALSNQRGSAFLLVLSTVRSKRLRKQSTGYYDVPDSN